MQINTTNHVTLPPEKLPGGVPAQSKNDQIIVWFYSDYRFWLLDYAETCINGANIADSQNAKSFVGNAGFAFLSLVNSYFDVTGQLCGSDEDEFDCYRKWDKKKFRTVKNSLHKDQNWKNWDASGDNRYMPPSNRCVWYGLTHVFAPDLRALNMRPKTNRDWAKFCHLFYLYGRNPIAHMGFPRKLLISADEQVPITVLTINKRHVLTINLPLWYKKISDHFNNYVMSIRFPKTANDKDLRQKFFTRFKRMGHPK